MRVILDTDKKTITVPWNYSDKLAEINRIIKDGGDKQYTFSHTISGSRIDIEQMKRKERPALPCRT